MFNFFDVILQAIISIADFGVQSALGWIRIGALPMGIDQRVLEYARAAVAVTYPILTVFDMRIFVPACLLAISLKAIQLLMIPVEIILNVLKNIPIVAMLW